MVTEEELKIITADDSNRLLGAEPRSCENTIVEFSGKNNILYMEKGVHLRNARIRFQGDNALLYLSKSRHRFNADITLETDTACVFGQGIFMNGTDPLRVRCRRGSTMIMGNDCLLSLGIEIDTGTGEQEGDPDAEPESESILIGQHVWLGQKVIIKGGSNIRSGAILGSEVTISGQKIPPGTCWGSRNGELRKVHDHIVFTRSSIRNTSKEDLWKYDTIAEDQMQEILELTKNHWKWVQRMIESESSAERRLALLMDSSKKRRYKLSRASKSEERPVRDNQIIGNYKNLDGNSGITFFGSGNVVILEEGVTLEHTHIAFNGDNSLVYLSKSDSPYRLRVSMHSDTTLYIGRDNRFAQGKPITFSVAEAQSVLIGSGCCFGQGIWFRTSDQHPIYDQETRKRLNQPRSILIGDYSDVPDDALIFKGRKIGIKEGGLLKNRYERILEKLQQTTDIEERIKLLKKLAKKV